MSKLDPESVSQTTSDQLSPGPANHADIFVESIQIRNFRGIRDLRLELERDLTVLVGPNNSGKSRILRALGLALGGLRADEDDLSKGDPRPAEIDVVIAPLETRPDGTQVFSDEIGRRLDPGLVQQEPDEERFAFRLTIKPSAEGHGALSRFGLLRYEKNSKAWILPNNPVALIREQFDCFSAHLVDTQRDLSLEIRKPGSSIRRILNHLEMPDDIRNDLEKKLIDLGGKIIDNSQALAAIQKVLDTADAAIDGFGKPALNPLPVSLEELSQAVSIDLDSGDGSLPMRLHGSGPRSLASLLVQSVFYERRLGKDGPNLRPLPVTLLEEPENHLHPQMQAELPGLLKGLPGQTVLSTHSSTLVTELEPHTIRLLRGDQILDLKPDPTSSIRFRKPEHNAVQIEILRRQIERPFGELLFCRAIVIGDGATERALLPPLIREALGPPGSGVCVVDPGSMASDPARAISRFAEALGIPWFLFADDDKAGLDAVAKLCPDFEVPGTEDHQRVILIGNGRATEQMLVEFDRDVCRTALQTLDRSVRADTDKAIVSHLGNGKGSVGRALAKALIDSHKPAD